MTMHLERPGRPRQLRRVLNATDPTAKIIIPAESMFVFNGTSADLAQQFYQRYQAGDSLHKLDIPHKKLPKATQDRLAAYKLKFKNLHSLLQRALIWDSGYVLDENAKTLVKIYTANGTSMADIAVSYQEFTEVAGCAASNCSSASPTTYRSGAKCNGDKLTPVLKCASEDVVGSTQARSIDVSSFWATGGNHRAIPELSIAQHIWEDSALNQTYSVNAIHSRALSEESSSSEDCAVRLPSMIIPCARYTDVSSSSGLTTTWGEPAPGKLVTVWLEHAHADRSGMSTAYTVFIVIGIVVGLVLLIVMCCKGQSRFKKRRQRRAEAKMTNADPQAFLDSSSDEVLEVSAVPLTPVHAILESDLESAPSSASSDWNNVFVSHRAVAGKRLRMDQLVLKKQIATGANSEIWAAKYHGARVTVKKILAKAQDEAEPDQSTTTAATQQHTPEFSVEIELLASLRHRNIVRFYGVAWDSPDSLCVITEYARKGNLQDLLRLKNGGDGTVPALTWDQIQRIMKGVASALQYLHTRQEPVVHGNLQARNVLLSSHFEPKLIGIGAAAAATNSQSEPHWRAPEVLQGAPSSLESDIYALGALFAELIAFKESSHALEEQVKSRQQSEAEEQKQGDELPVGATTSCCPQAIKDVVALCVDANPSARPRASEVTQVLQQQ